jgi:iron complex outermembrane receptor protein
MLRRSQSLISLLLLSSLTAVHAQDATPPAPTPTPSPTPAPTRTESVTEDAQDKKQQPEKKAERIQVTGSRIRQLDLEGPKPVITVDRKELEKSGAVNLNEALNKMTVASFGSAEYGSNYGAPEGTQSVDLRGLGQGNTLVLLNGRRLVRDPSLEFVDLSVIPTAAVERVEIITGTASAIYGTDALAGVINIITRKQYDGMSFGYSMTKARFGGGDRDQAYVMSGTNSERTSNLITLQWDESKPILGKDRPWFDTDFRSTRGTPFSYQTAGGFAPVGACVDGDKFSGANNQNRFCGYDYWDIYQVQGNWQKVSLLDEFSYQVTDDTRVNLRVFGTKKTAKTKGLPEVIDVASDAYTVSQAAVNQLHPDLLGLGADAPNFKPDPNNGDQAGVLVHGRVPQSISGTKTDQTTFSAALGLVHNFGDDQEIEFNVSDSRIYRSHVWTNFLDDQRFREAVFSGEFDVLSQEPKGDPSLYSVDVPDTDSATAKSAEINYSGTFDLFGQTAGYSVGASHILESYENRAAPNKLAGQIKGLGGGGGAGERKANAVYAEVGMPIVSTLEASVAARFDDYSDFGSTFNPMVGLQYRLGREFFFRVNGGTGFKAPTLRDLHDEEARYFTSFTDYRLCNEATANNDQGNITKYCTNDMSSEIRSGGNPDLDPQTSTSVNVFVGYEPIIGTGLSLEYFNQQIKDVITTISADELMQLEADGRDLPNGTAIIRDPTTNEVTEIVSPSTNLSTVKASGLTLGAYTAYTAGFGTLSYKADYSYYLTYTSQKLPGGKFEQYLEEGGTPRWRWTNTFGYSFGDNNVRLISNSNGRYQKSNKQLGYVGSFTSWDLNYGYTVSQNFDFELGGTNIFNQGFPHDDSDAIGRGVGNAFYPMIGPTFFTRLNFHI